MNLAALSAIYPGYVKGQEQLAQMALMKDKADDAKRQGVIEAGVGRSLMSDPGTPSGGLGALSSAPPPQGPGQPSVPMQPGPVGGPPPGPPQGALPPGAAPPPAPGPQGAPPQGQPPQGAAPPQQGQPQSQGPMTVGQMAKQIMAANPGMDFKSPEGARALLGMVERNQQLLAPQAKQELANISLAMKIDQANQKLELGYANLETRKQIADQANEFRAQIAQVRDQATRDHMQQQMDALDKKLAAAKDHTDTTEAGKDRRLDQTETGKSDRLGTQEAGKSDRLGTQEAGRDSRSDAGIASREKIAGGRTDAQLAQLAAKSGVAIPFGTEPAKAQQMIAEAITKKMDKSVISDDDAKFVADIMKTDPSFISHIGSGATANQSKAKVLQAMQTGGAAPEDVAKAKVALAGSTAEQRKISGQAGNVALGTEELEQFAPMVLEAAKRVNLSQYPTINSIVQAAQRKTGSPEIITLGDNIQALKGAYTQILVRGGQGGVEARQRADELISPNMSPRQLEAAIAALRAEGKGATAAAKNATAEVAGAIGGKGKPTEPAAAPAGGGSVIKYDAEGNRIP